MNEIKTMNIDDVLKNMMRRSETVNANDGNIILKRDEAEYNRLLEGSKIIPDYIDLDGLNKVLSNMRGNVKTANDGTILSVEYLDAYNKLIDCINDISKINDKYVSKDTAVTLEDIAENKEVVDNFYTDNDNPINFSAYGDDNIKEDESPFNKLATNDYISNNYNVSNPNVTTDELEDSTAIVNLATNDSISNNYNVSNPDVTTDELEDSTAIVNLATNDYISNNYNVSNPNVTTDELEDSKAIVNLATKDSISNNYNVSNPDVTTDELEDSKAISNIGDKLTNHLNTQYHIDTRNKILDKKSRDSLNYLQGLIDTGEAQNYGLTQEILDDSSYFRMMAMEQAIKNSDESKDSKAITNLATNDSISNNYNVSKPDVTPIELENSTAISNIGDKLTNHLNTQYHIDTYNKILDKKSRDSLNYLQGLIDTGEAQNYGLTQEILDDSSYFRMMAMEQAIKNSDESKDAAVRKH